jgi:peptidoglycan L-alanyl-D-glutamate endopeptidase CwlK
MPSYGKRSRKVLATLHPDLQVVFQAVLTLGFDHSLIEGHRDEETQNFYYDQGKSKLRFPGSKHNQLPSLAVDAMPWHNSLPHIDWDHFPSIFHFAGVVRGVAAMLYSEGKITHLIRWGGDWDRDFDVREKQWDDLPHFELYQP